MKTTAIGIQIIKSINTITKPGFSDELRNLLEDSLRMQIRSDVPLEAICPGGLIPALYAV